MSVPYERILELAREITGQSDHEAAISEALTSYIERKLADYQRILKRYERKYGMSFAQFAKKLKDVEFVKQLEIRRGIINLENDYFEWEGLVSEVEHLRRKLQELKPVTSASL